MKEIIGNLKVLEVKDLPDGSAEIILDVPDAFKKSFVKAMNWKRWSRKKFNKYVVDSLTEYVRDLESKNNGSSS